MQVRVSISNLNNARAWWRQQPRRIDMAISRTITQLGYEARRELTSKEGLRKFPRHDTKKSRSIAPVGGPPQQGTGKLASTVYVAPGKRLGFANYEKAVGPTMLYARVQDEGATIQAKTPFGMRFTYGKVDYHHVQKVTIPPRPYMQAARDRMVNSGRIEQIILKEMQRAFSAPLT